MFLFVVRQALKKIKNGNRVNIRLAGFYRRTEKTENTHFISEQQQ